MIINKKMKTHLIKCRTENEFMLFTKCGLLFWPKVNDYHDKDVVTKDITKVTCKNCLKLFNKEHRDE